MIWVIFLSKNSIPEIPNQSNKIQIIVVKGTAPEDFFPQMKKFKKKLNPKMTPGYKSADCNAADFQSDFGVASVLNNRPAK